MLRVRLRLGSVEHDLTTRTLVMGVLDRAPSFLGTAGGAVPDDLLRRAEAVVEEDADVLDVGGVPAGPGPPVGEAEELERLVPVVEALRARFDVPLSIDTWRGRVAVEACAAGAAVVHDGSGFVDPDYLPAAAEAGAVVVVTHTRLPPDTVDVVEEVHSFLARQVVAATAAGIGDDRIVVDPGLDVGKSPAQSLTLLRESAALAGLGPPLRLDTSDKRFLGRLLDLEAGERRVAGHAAAALGIARGCRIVRTNDVRGARRVAAVLEALLAARLASVLEAAETDA